MMRARYSQRIKTVSLYCKDINWPRALDDADGDEDDELTQTTKKAAKKKDANKTLDEKIATYKPVVSEYLGGAGLEQDKKKQQLKKPATLSKQDEPGLPSAGEKGQIPTESLQDLSQVRITADHRACADLYAVYVFNMYRRQEMAKIWQGMAFAYDTVLKNFVSLLGKVLLYRCDKRGIRCFPCSFV